MNNRGIAFTGVFVGTLWLCVSLSRTMASAPGGMVMAWGDNTFGETTIPPGLPTAVGVAAGLYRSLALLPDGEVVVWGNLTYGEAAPAFLTNATAIAAGALFNLALDTRLGVVAWGGNDTYGETTIPSGIRNPVAIAAGYEHSLALSDDGTVTAWGWDNYGQANVPTGLSNVVALAAGEAHTLALQGDGTLVGWGDNSMGQIRIPGNLSNVVAIAAGFYHSLALMAGGTVAAWGRNDSGQSSVPSSLTNVVAIAAGEGFSVALRTDGTVVAWGGMGSPPAAATNVVAIAAGDNHVVALANPLVSFLGAEPCVRTAYSGATVILEAAALAPPKASYQWRVNGTNISGATDELWSLTNVQPSDAGTYSVMAASTYGSTASSNLILSVLSSAPMLVEQPTNQTAAPGVAAAFVVSAVGSLPMSCQWQLNGTNLAGATGLALALTNLQPSNAGTYTAVLSNQFGVSVSSNAVLTVLDLGGALDATNLTWTTSGDALWFAQGQETHDGLAAAQSGGIGGSQQSTLETTADGPATLTFWWGTSCLADCGYLTFLLDGQPQMQLTGVTGWLPATAYLGAGPQVLDWTYSEAYVEAYGQDAGWVDQVTLAPGGTAPFVTAQPSSLLVLQGTMAALSAGVLGTPPLSCQWVFNQTILAGATNASLVLTNAELANGGTYSLVVSNGFGVTNTSTVLLTVVDLAAALDTTNLVWSSGGAVPWYPETPTAHDGVAAAQSGAILVNQQSTLQTSVSGPGTLSFWWKVSSYTNSNYAAFSVDGSEQARISGNVNWQQKTFYLAPGAHALNWSYSKTASAIFGSDAAWLDQVSYAPGATAAFVLANPTNQTVPLGSNAIFTVVAQGTPPLAYQWLFNTQSLPGATDPILSVPHVQTTNAGNYAVLVSNAYGSALSASAALALPNVLAWGAGPTYTVISPNYGQSLVPTNLGAATAVAAGGYHSLALVSGGTVAAWGWNGAGETNVPAGLSNLTAIGAGLYHSVGLQTNGVPAIWGGSSYGVRSAPASATNLATLSCGWYHNLALRSNGTVVAWGAGTYQSAWPICGQCLVPTNLTGVAAIAAGGAHSLALRSNGTVVAWGWNAYGQTNVPAGLSNVIAIAAGGSNSIALKNDGTLVAWGNNASGQTNIPAGLSNAVAIAAGGGHDMALRNDGTLIVWGLNGNGQTNVPAGLTNVAAISAGGYHSLVLINTGPITFLGPPQNQVVYKGAAVTLAAPCLGYAPVTYQWLHNGTNVPGATTAPLVLSAAQLADAGRYQLAASNYFGLVTSAALELTVIDTAPVFTLQPTNEVVLQGSNTTLTASATGLPPIAYQWQLNGMPVNGATNAALALTNVQPANAGYYSVVATTSSGMTVSSNALLSVIGVAQALGPTNLVWSNPSQSPWFVESGTTHDGLAAAEAGPLSYDNSSVLQTYVTGPGTLTFWYLAPSFYASLSFSIDGITWLNTGYSSIPSWMQASYYIGAGVHPLSWTAANTGFFGGAGVVYLDQVVFTPGPTPVALVAQPVNQTNIAGSSVTFSVTTLGTPPFGYQWYFNSTLLPGATSASLALANIQAGSAGAYEVLVTNAYGAVTSSNATLTVIPSAPVFTAQPAGATVLAGGQTTFTGVTIGTSPVSYQWLFNGLAIPDATNASLTLSDVQYANAGIFSLLATNSIGAITSSNAGLSVYTVADLGAALDCPAITWSTTNVPWFPQTNTTYDGVSAAQSGAISGAQQSVLQGVVSGPAIVTYWWKVNCDSFWMSLAFVLNGSVQTAITGSVDWQPATNYIGAGSQTLQWNLYPVHGAFAGGTAWVDQVQLAPGGVAPFLTAQPASVTTNAGNPVTFSVSAAGTPPLRYQWQFNGTSLPDGTNATLTLGNVQATNTGSYAAVVFNGFGSNTSACAALIVSPSAPVITSQPATQSAAINGSVSFLTAAEGSTPFGYQWLFNGSLIAGATSPTLSLTGLQATNAGTYRVVVANPYGSTTSSSAFLEVNPTIVVDCWASVGAGYSAPFGLSNITAIAAGVSHTVGLRMDGTVVSWGSNGYGQTNLPANLSNVVAITAGSYHTAALKSDGTVVLWGDNTYGQLLAPSGLSNVTAVVAAANDTFALRTDGTVVGWGNNSGGQLNIPAGLSNVVAIAAGVYNGFAVRTDGTVLQWGSGPTWEDNGVNTQLAVGSGMNDVTAIAAGSFSAWSLDAEANVRAWGWDESPMAAFGIAALAAAGAPSPDYDYVVALTYNGTLFTAWPFGMNFGLPYAPSIPTDLFNIVGVSAANTHAALLVNDGTPRVVGGPSAQTATNGSTVLFSPGIVGAPPLGYQWQFNGTNLAGATNQTLVLTNVSLAAAGSYRCVAGNSLGTVTNSGSLLVVSRSTPRFGPLSFWPSTGLGLELDQLSGHGPIVVYASSNLLDWQPVFTNPPQAGSLRFVDPSATNTPARFYRAVEQ